jgi:glycerol uptake facilitator-like aquaporin
MKKRFLLAAIVGGLVLTLALFPGGCDNPARDSGPSAAQAAFELN